MWWVHHQHYLYSKNVNAVANMYSAKPGWQIFHCIFLCIKYGFQCFKEKRDRKTTTRKAKKKKKWHINSRYLSCCKKKNFGKNHISLVIFFTPQDAKNSLQNNNMTFLLDIKCALLIVNLVSVALWPLKLTALLNRFRNLVYCYGTLSNEWI